MRGGYALPSDWTSGQSSLPPSPSLAALFFKDSNSENLGNFVYWNFFPIGLWLLMTWLRKGKRQIAQLAESSIFMVEDPRSIRAGTRLYKRCFFDKINRRFKITIVSFIQKTCHPQVSNPQLHDKRERAHHLCYWNTRLHLNTYEFCTLYILNFVLKAGILNPLTSPSILWTILFVCTRSCKLDEIHLLYRQGFAFTIAWKHRVFGSL